MNKGDWIKYLLQAQIAVIVAYLEVQSEYGRELREVRLVVAEQLHEPDRQHKQTSRFCEQTTKHQLSYGNFGKIIVQYSFSYNIFRHSLFSFETENWA